MANANLLTINPAAANYPFGSNPVQTSGRGGEGVVNELDGRNYIQNYNGGLYYASNAAAGAAFTIFSNTTFVGLALINPLGSGKNLSMVRASIGVNANAATAASAWGYAWVNGITGQVVGTLAPITASTAITATRGSCIASPAGKGTSVVDTYSSVTLSTALTWGRNANFGTMTGAITVAAGQMLYEDFDGTMIVPPGTLFVLTSAILSGITAVGTLIWSEKLA